MSCPIVSVSPEIDELIPRPPATFKVSVARAIVAAVELSSTIPKVVDILAVDVFVILP